MHPERPNLAFMFRLVLALMRNDDGATIVEYAIVLSLVAVVAILAITKMGNVAASSLGSDANSI